MIPEEQERPFISKEDKNDRKFDLACIVLCLFAIVVIAVRVYEFFNHIVK